MPLFILALMVWFWLARLGFRFSDRCERLLDLVLARQGITAEAVTTPWQLRLFAKAFTPLIGMPVQGAILIANFVICAATQADERWVMRFLAAQGARGHGMLLDLSDEDVRRVVRALDRWTDLGWADE